MQTREIGPDGAVGARHWKMPTAVQWELLSLTTTEDDDETVLAVVSEDVQPLVGRKTERKRRNGPPGMVKLPSAIVATTGGRGCSQKFGLGVGMPSGVMSAVSWWRLAEK